MNDVRERRQQLLGNATLFYQDPVHIVRGEGVRLYDESGREYLDLYNNVPCVGHANPHVVEAVARQMGTLNVHSRYLHGGVLDYADRLLALHHDDIESVVFACSGTEAVEVALMMARAATGGEGIICTDATYHGNSAEVRKMTRASVHGHPVDPNFRAIRYPQTYRPLVEHVDDEALCDAYLEGLAEAIRDFEKNGIRFAALVMCSIFANEGLPVIPGRFMEKATAMVREAGGLVIADEVQAGFCRSGDWWGYETTGFRPDIVTMGKPMGNGIPLSGCAASRELVAAFRDNTRYFTTFASSPVQAAAGMAVLDVIESEGLLARSAAVGRTLYEAIAAMAGDVPWIGDVRGTGLFVGIDVVKDKVSREEDLAAAVTLVNRLRNKGFLISNAGERGNVLKIRPPLVFESHHAESFLTGFREVVAEHG